MKNKIGSLIILICILIVPIGCNRESHTNIIIDEDVNYINDLSREPGATGQVQIKLKKESVFHPLYYFMGEIYGYIGTSHNSSEEDIIRRYIYKIDKFDNLEETSTEYRISPLDKEDTEFELGTPIITDDKGHNTSMKMLDLNYRLYKLKEKNINNSYEVKTVSGNDDFIIIRENTEESIEKIYLYDNKDKNYYSPSKDIKSGEICYVDTLDALVWVDQQDFKIYKIILKDLPFYIKEGFYHLEEYIDLGIEDINSRVRAVMKNGNEMILLQDRFIKDNGIYKGSPLYETNLVTKFIFSTNQYNYVYRKPTTNYIYIEYLGHDILSIEEFDLIDYAYITPRFRRVFRMAGRVVNLIYQEEYENQSEQFYPTNEIIINEEGKEIFTTRKITIIENDKLITEDVIYQRIDISNKKIR